MAKEIMESEPLRRRENVVPFRARSAGEAMVLSALIHKTLRHFENRLFELATSAMMILIALHVALWPSARLDFLPPVGIVAIYGLGGALRFAALIANGSWPRHGPKLRALGAFAGAMVWAQMLVASLRAGGDAAIPPTLDMWVYLTLAAVELIAMCRALVDNERYR